MSIANRHPTVRKMLIQSKQRKIPVINKPWVVAYFITYLFGYDPVQSNIEYQLFRLSIETMKTELRISQFNIYTVASNIPQLIPITLKYNVEIFEQCATKLCILRDLLDKKYNIIVLNHRSGCANRSGYNIMSQLSTDENIYALFSNIDQTNKVQAEISVKLNFNQIINSDLLIIPCSLQNYDYIIRTLDMAERLHTDDQEFSANISLTVANKKLNYFVKNLL